MYGSERDCGCSIAPYFTPYIGVIKLTAREIAGVEDALDVTVTFISPNKELIKKCPLDRIEGTL
jgi:hypothetical protein